MNGGINFMGGYPPPPETPPDSPFRRFVVRCLNCRSYRLRFVSEYDEESGETAVWIVCPRCRVREQMPMR